MAEEVLLMEKQERICTITINRPDQRNSLSPELLHKLADTLEAINDDEDVRVVVIRGSGERAFSAGYDIGRIQTGKLPDGAQSQDAAAGNPVQRALESVMRYRYPVIAMVYGFAVGAGCDLAVTCDLRFAADTARFGITPAKLGILYDYQGMRRFIDVVGVGATKELFLTGGLIDAQRAKEIGLANRVVPAQDLASVTYAVAKEIAENAPLAVSGAKATIGKLTGFPRLSAEDEAEIAAMVARCSASEDLKEGQRAFLEKRKPNFRGR